MCATRAFIDTEQSPDPERWAAFADAVRQRRTFVQMRRVLFNSPAITFGSVEWRNWAPRRGTDESAPCRLST
jgi:hypothetical protein